MGPEKKFETKVKNFLSTLGIYALGTEKQKMTNPPIGYYEKRFANRNTKKGLPDMHVCIHGISLEVEVKADDGIPSDLQIRMCEQIRNSGGHAYVVYPNGFNDFKEIVMNLVYHTDDKKKWPIILK